MRTQFDYAPLLVFGGSIPPLAISLISKHLRALDLWRSSKSFDENGSKFVFLVRRFVQERARVAFSDLLLEKGKALEKELGKNVAFYRADSMSPSDIESLMNFTVEHFGKLDCVVNNAGAGSEGGPIEKISVEGFDRAIALLLRGPFLGITPSRTCKVAEPSSTSQA